MNVGIGVELVKGEEFVFCFLVITAFISWCGKSFCENNLRVLVGYKLK